MKVPSRKIAQILIIFAIGSLSFLLAMGAWRGKTQKKQEVPETPSTEAEMKLTDMEFTEMQQGRKFWTMHASEAQYFQDQQKTLLKTVQVTFYLEKTGEEVHIESSEGILYAGTKNIELRGAVRAHFPREYVANMEKALYDHQKRLIWSDEPVQVSGPGLELEGQHWEYRIPEHATTLSGGIKASLIASRLRIEN
ncbi:MAG: LPS export ABC transporter periplasmic protein LptC [Desulfobacteraceae bacterium]|nr:LPS export ABC transporter periplasmic protein LptC [Desulfobacteraceae bacterium]